MTQPPAFMLEPARSAVVIMDFQEGIVGTVARDPEGTVARAASVLAAARGAGIPLIFVQHRGGRFEAASPEAAWLPALAPLEGDTLLMKRRAGSFSTTALDVILRERGRDTLVLMGVATSGCVLSTVRWAADINYRLVVVRDACDDADAEVHRVLTEKLFPRQATVVTAAEFVAAASVG
jgi:nicotinamidase-related amidase